MFTVIWTFIKPYVSNIFVWIIVALIAISVTQTVRLTWEKKDNEILTVKLTAAIDKLAIQKVEFEKLKIFADAQDAKLKLACQENVDMQKAHQKKIATILKSRLPATATCEDAAKWARDIVRGRK